MNAITVTKDEFLMAINDEMRSVLDDPSNLDKAEAKMMFVMSGTIFAQSVMKRLFESKKVN